MKLIPKARPVRIRISSSGVEHSSIASLKEHFSLKDVMELIANGSLTRWLRQCGESELASMIECASEDNKIDVLKAFFPELNKINSEIELVIYLYHSGKKETASYLFNSDLTSDINAIKQAWINNIKGIDFFPLFNKHWEEDGELAFLFARACANGDFEIEDFEPSSVKMVLDTAIELGSRQALEFQDSDAWQDYVRNDRFWGIDKEKMKKHILDVFEYGRRPKTTSDIERSILAFARDVSVLATEVTLYTTFLIMSSNERIFQKRKDKENPLHPEYALIYTLIFSKEEDVLKDYEKESVVVQQYLHDEIKVLSLSRKLRYIVEHLLD